MIAADRPTIQLEAAERRRILAKVYGLLISLAEEMDQQEDVPQVVEAPERAETAATRFEICLSTLQENSEQVEVPAPLKPNSPP